MNPQPQQNVRLHIRWMIRRDMPEVLDIEFPAVLSSPGPRMISSDASDNATVLEWLQSTTRVWLDL